MSNIEDRLKFIRYWKEKTGEPEVDMLEVAKMAMEKGWDAPAPISAEERLAKLFKNATRRDIRYDKKTGMPYRGYHAVPKIDHTGQQSSLFTFIDIDDPDAKPDRFQRACVLRREQSVGDLTQLRLDQMHWNDSRSENDQIDFLPADCELDVEIRIASMDEDEDDVG